ncbi:MAG: trypsin-like peptidase domain-containing protein [Rhizobacter sp.]|nr:trypsin-like peptidase domain-containing protein [Bacteriovorax sp.]
MKFFTLALLSLATVSAFAVTPIKIVPKVIYGEDDRLDIFESNDNLMKEIALSTAAQILNRNLIEDNGVFTVKSETLAESGMCKSERFANQPAAANCSGFLVAPDVLVTAGHCINSDMDCQGHSWVFDFANKTEEQKTFTFNKDQVYRCSKIIERKKDQSTMADYTVLKLERAVVGRAPLKFRTEGKPADDAVFTVIGHPTGLPTKITAAADMRNNTNPVFFVTNADTYGGNSGSAVVDSRTGIVEGILVRGDTDYTSTEEGCLGSVHRPQDGGRGEDVTRITIIEALKKH